MGVELKIWSTREGNNIGEIIWTPISYVYNFETIEKLQNMGRKNWYVDSECGAEFELQGSELNSIKDLIECIKTINGEFDDEDWYRCSLRY